jgi:predicted MPP superfamily phosphohydrolase
MQILLIAFLLFGHVALWVALFNRLHALSVRCRAIRLLELVIVLGAAGSALGIARESWSRPAWLYAALEAGAGGGALGIYVAFCCLFAAWVGVHWILRRGWVAPAAGLRSNHTERIDVAARLGVPLVRGWSTRLFAAVPGNQMLQLHIHCKEAVLPRLSPDLDGLSVLHLSDLHFTGRIARPYFEYIVQRSNELNADLIAITGDIVEFDACLDWLPLTLGRLRSRHGVYFVLGNHDKRLRDVQRLRRSLTELGLYDLGRRSQLLPIGRRWVLLAGNELPWFGPPPELIAAPDDSCPLRVLLSHSPDQITWARRRDFDLMLAGHTHGGHIRLPLMGAVVCPSRFGVKYAAGTFYEPPTMLHVSRGISGLDALRFNCPPELTRLVLRAPAAEGLAEEPGPAVGICCSAS